MGASGAEDGGAKDVSLDPSGRRQAGVQPAVAVTEREPGAGQGERPPGTPRDAGAGGGPPGTHQDAGPAGRPPGTPGDDGLDAPLFTGAALDYAAHRPGQSLTVLQAGCTTAGCDPDVATLRAAGCHVAVSLIDEDSLASRAAVGAHPELASCALGDLRITPLPPRSFDIVHCALLLERISHAELVLDRFVEALKPGGLLLPSTGDRDCAAGFLDRVLPRSVRAMIWRRHRPGEPGPYPAVYEHLVAGRGIQSYALRRGLVIGPRQPLNLLAAQRRPPGLLMASRLVPPLSRARLP